MLVALAAIPAATAQVPSLDIQEDILGEASADGAATAYAGELAADQGTDVADMAAAFEGICVGADPPGANGNRDSDPPVVLDDPDEDDSTGVEFGGSAEDGSAIRACIIPCMPVAPWPPEIRQGCIDDWTWYICGSTCVAVVHLVYDTVCSSCSVTWID